MVAVEAPANPDQLVDALVAGNAVTSPRVEAALRAVPRHLFVPHVSVEAAYRNEAIPTKLLDGRAVSSASQPSIVAVMLEQLDVARGQRILEVGAGTGYNAALLRHLVGPNGRVVTIDIDEDIVEGARAHLAAAGIEDVAVVCGDGALGHPADAPYDRVVLTVGAWDIAPAWWDQLAEGGRLLIPLSLRGVQRCVALENHNARLESASVRDCGFMRLRGGFRGPETVVSTGAVTVTFDTDVDASAIPEILNQPAGAAALDVSVSMDELWGGLALWLALHDPGYCTLNAAWPSDGEPPLPVAAAFPSGETQVGWSPASFDGATISVLARGPSGVVVHSFGQDLRCAERLVERASQWAAAGRPDSQSLRMHVRRGDAPAPEGAVTNGSGSRSGGQRSSSGGQSSNCCRDVQRRPGYGRPERRSGRAVAGAGRPRTRGHHDAGQRPEGAAQPRFPNAAGSALAGTDGRGGGGMFEDAHFASGPRVSLLRRMSKEL